ncbi:barstar family protein [Streptomyces sp. NPDC048606]|uniref:barstar family protein n=1 Tax=Streptomyces sp. NPDC048606 TaxID=3154726 RepID=UPI0034394102
MPGRARPIWERRLTGPPRARNAWADVDAHGRDTWLGLVRDRGCALAYPARPAGRVHELDGRYVTDEPGLWLALGEAVNGPGGYFGGCVDALVDCLRGGFGLTRPAELIWHDAATARAHLSHLLTPDGDHHDLFALVLEVLTERGIHVTLR